MKIKAWSYFYCLQNHDQ